MKTTFVITFLLFLCSATMAVPLGTDGKILAEGNQPQVSVDNRSTVRIVYGQKDKIFCLESHDGGLSFPKPLLIAEVADMHLGMSRGPQLTSSNRYSVVTAMDKSGNIHWFRLNHASGKWESMGLINDRTGSAPEGLMNIASDNNDHFYAVWLDIRTGKHNQVYFADLAPKATKWSKNRLLYMSPDEHVCECCQPHIAVNGTGVAVMFRNWLNGSRDLYLIRSQNSGTSFSSAQKLGAGTWKLNGCPMDGGGLTTKTASVVTTWRREGTVYYCKPGQPETAIGQGRNSTIAATSADTFIGFQTVDTLKLVGLANKKVRLIGTGEFMKLAVLPDKKIVCVWELDNKVILKVI
jgi:hypothetical protein